MKKLLPILLGAVFVLLGCQQPMLPVQPMTVESLINNSKDEVDLSGVTCNEDVTVTKAVKIKNGDFNGKTLTVNVSGVTLENAKKVNVVVAEAVGDGDFTVTASDITSFKVLGGGANSIHVKDTKVSEILVAKENVRVSLEGKSNITKLKVKKGVTAKLEVNSSEVKIDAAEVVAEDGSKLDGESVTLTVAEGVSFTAPEGSNAVSAPSTPAAGGSDKTEFTLSFDDSKIVVYTGDDSQPVTLKNGDKVKIGDRLVILCQTVETDKVVDKIVISGKEYNPGAALYSYYIIESLNSTYANGSVIEISYTTRDAAEYTITLQEGISCSNNMDGKPVSTGSTVKEGQTLYFTATPPSGKVVDKWYVNGTEQIGYSGRDIYGVTLQSSQITGNTVEVTYTTRDAAEYTITLQEGISCKVNNQPVSTGSTVKEGQHLSFTVTPPSGKVVDKWFISGTEQINFAGRNDCNVTLQSSLITGNTVEVTYTTKDAVAYTVTFGEEISCTDFSSDQGRDVPSGSTVKEGQTLYFTVTPPAGKVVDKWYVNGKEQIGYSSNYCPVTLQSSQITGNTVNVTVTYKAQ